MRYDVAKKIYRDMFGEESPSLTMVDGQHRIKALWGLVFGMPLDDTSSSPSSCNLLSRNMNRYRHRSLTSSSQVLQRTPLSMHTFTTDINVLDCSSRAQANGTQKASVQTVFALASKILRNMIWLIQQGTVKIMNAQDCLAGGLQQDIVSSIRMCVTALMVRFLNIDSELGQIEVNCWAKARPGVDPEECLELWRRDMRRLGEGKVKNDSNGEPLETRCDARDNMSRGNMRADKFSTFSTLISGHSLLLAEMLVWMCYREKGPETWLAAMQRDPSLVDCSNLLQLRTFVRDFVEFAIGKRSDNANDIMRVCKGDAVYVNSSKLLKVNATAHIMLEFGQTAIATSGFSLTVVPNVEAVDKSELLQNYMGPAEVESSSSASAGSPASTRKRKDKGDEEPYQRVPLLQFIIDTYNSILLDKSVKGYTQNQESIFAAGEEIIRRYPYARTNLSLDSPEITVKKRYRLSILVNNALFPLEPFDNKAQMWIFEVRTNGKFD